MRNTSILPYAAILIGLAFLGLPLAGCADLPDAQTKSQVQSITNKSAVDVARTKAADQLASLHGKDSPVTHPIAASNEVVTELRPWLILLSLAGIVGWIICFAFSSELPFLATLTTPLRWIAVLGTAATFSLAFLPVGFFLLGLSFVGLVIYELVKTRSIGATETAVVTEIKSLVGDVGTVASAAGVPTTVAAAVTVTTQQPATGNH